MTLRKGDFPALNDVVADMKADMTPSERSEWEEAQAASNAATERWIAEWSPVEGRETVNTDVLPEHASRRAAQERSRPAYQIHSDGEGRFRWSLLAPNGRTIAMSGESYATRSDCLIAIGAVRRFAASPVIAA